MYDFKSTRAQRPSLHLMKQYIHMSSHDIVWLIVIFLSNIVLFISEWRVNKRESMGFEQLLVDATKAFF